MANQLTGRILSISPIQNIPTKSGATFAKRELVLDCTRFDPYTGERGFENTPVIEFTQDRCSLLDNLAPGTVITVAIDIQGMRSGERYFNSIRGYRVDLRQQYQAAPQLQAAPAPIPAQPAYASAVAAPNVYAQPAAPAAVTAANNAPADIDPLPF